MEVRRCERCDAAIPSSSYNHDRPFQLYRMPSPKQHDTAEIHLCSICLDEVWEFVLDESPDRSDVADPVQLTKMADNVDGYIEDLQGMLNQIEGAKP